MNVSMFWNIAPCSPHVNRHLGATFHLHLQGQTSAEQETNVKQVVSLVSWSADFLP
jgi:hypothetical protein